MYAVRGEFLSAYLRSHDVVCLPPDGTPQVTLSVLVPVEDALRLPELDDVEVLMSEHPDFAYEQLVEVVGV